MDKPILYFIVPCYNEEEALPLTAPEFRKKLEELKDKVSPLSRIVLVNDGSRDRTPEIIRELHENDAAFSGIFLRGNHGHQNALTTGLMWARDKCDITISIDADLQDDLNAADEMVEKYVSEGCGMVCGVRSSRTTDTFLKRTTAQGYYKLMKLFGSDLIYNHADYRLMDRSALNALAMYHGEDLFLRGFVHRLGAKVGTVFYERRAREAGESKYTIKKMLKLAAKGVSCARCKPQTDPRPLPEYLGEILHS